MGDRPDRPGGTAWTPFDPEWDGAVEDDYHLRLARLRYANPLGYQSAPQLSRLNTPEPKNAEPEPETKKSEPALGLQMSEPLPGPKISESLPEPNISEPLLGPKEPSKTGEWRVDRFHPYHKKDMGDSRKPMSPGKRHREAYILKTPDREKVQENWSQLPPRYIQDVIRGSYSSQESRGGEEDESKSTDYPSSQRKGGDEPSEEHGSGSAGPQ